ncbi:MAG: DUF3791 domain-containing protein [Clostridium sp.]
MNEKNIEFVIFCVEGIAEKLNIESKEAYRLLEKDSGIVSEYIAPFYEVLHTQGKEYIVNELMEVMQKRGVI